MGAYLSEPVTEKYSSDKESSSVSFGASSMQGWRVSQEDAHNCIIEYDKDCSLFAVYDGHGGAEVAQYCSQHLPNFIKATKAYKEGNIAQALEDAFLEFDKTLVRDDILQELKQMAGVEEEPVEEDESEVDHLYQEAHMPLEELLAKYRSALGNPQLRHLCNDKPQSPYLRGKKPEEIVGDSAGVSSNAEAADSKAVVTASGDCGESEAIARVGTTTVTTKATSDVKTKMDVKHSAIKTDDIQTDCVGSSSGIHQSVSSTKSLKDDNEVVSSSENKTESLVNGDDRLAAVTCSTKTVASSSDDVAVTESKVCESSSDKVATKNGQVDTNSSISTTTTELPERVGKGKGRGKGKGKSLAPNSSIVILSDGKKVAASSTPKAPVRQGIHRQARPVSMEDASENSEESDTDEEYEGQVSEPDEEEEDEEEAEGEEEDEDEEDDDNEDEEEEDDEDENEDDDDEAFTISDKEEPGFDSGCTAVVALMRGDELYVGNAGDSRCVVCRKGVAIDMSHDHKPEDEVEMKRIVSAGGKVTSDGRVNGGLNLSRAIGDHSYKKNTALSAKDQMISALPDIRTLTIDPDEDEFMVVACDGIWNFMSSQEVIDFVRERLNKNPGKLSSICEELFDHCLSPTTIGDGTGCDNMTCVIVKFNSLPTKAGAKRRADDSAVATTTTDSEAIPIVSSSKRAKSDVSSSE